MVPRIYLILILCLLVQDFSILANSLGKESVIRSSENFHWSFQSLLDLGIVIAQIKTRRTRKYAEDSRKHKYKHLTNHVDKRNT